MAFETGFAFWMAGLPEYLKYSGFRCAEMPWRVHFDLAALRASDPAVDAGYSLFREFLKLCSTEQQATGWQQVAIFFVVAVAIAEKHWRVWYTHGLDGGIGYYLSDPLPAYYLALSLLAVYDGTPVPTVPEEDRQVNILGKSADLQVTVCGLG